MNFAKVFLISFLSYLAIFFLLSTINEEGIRFQSEDYIGTAALPFSLIREGNLNLNEMYSEIISKYPNPDDVNQTPYYLTKIRSNYYSIRPITTSLLAIPVYILPAIFLKDIQIQDIELISHIGGAFITALSVGFFFLVAKKLANEKWKQILLVIIYTFATNSLSTSSQGLWQHGNSQLILSAALLSVLNNKHNWAFLLLGIATASRPSNLLSLVVLGLYMLIKDYREGNLNFKKLISYAFLGMLPYSLETLLSSALMGNIDSYGYSTQLSGWRNNPITGFLGLWLSPSKGILTTSPILIFIFYGIYTTLKGPRLKDLKIYLIAIILLHTLIMGAWYSWYGGYSWGYRMASDVLPFIVLLLIPFLNSKYFQINYIKTIFFILLGISIFIHLLGAIGYDGTWHIIYDKGSDNQAWLWSVKDSQPVFYVKKMLAKLGLAENPIPLDLRAP